jgi:cysteine-rich repeat protein
MLRTPPYRLALAAVSLAIGCLIASPARAERLLAPVLLQRSPSDAAALPGVTRVQPLALGRTALAELRASARATVERFPLGRDGAADLELTRFEPFTPNARAEIVTKDGVRALALPDRAYFRGKVRGKPDSHVLVVAAPAEVHGFVAVDGEVYPFGPDEAGRHRGYALSDIDTGVYPPPSDFCANDLRPDEIKVPTAADATARAAARALAEPGIAAATTLKQADVAIETDEELRAKFASDQDALDYLASLAAAATAIYESDVSVRLRFSYVRLWSPGTDPWTESDTVDALYEVQNWWNTFSNGMYTVDRDLTHFISGKPVQGGVAYLGVLCNSYWAYGVSQVFGSFNLASPTQIWDVVVTTHEIGHNFGSPHTHCYDPPIDHCYAGEGGCYSGPVTPSQGTIMSYCHLSGGLAAIDLVFGPTVSAYIGTYVDAASCLSDVQTGPGCGNGIVESGETCDDDNTADGDCCSATCQLEASGSTCGDDGNACTDDQCDGAGACTHPAKPDGGACTDDGNPCTDDQCSAGACVHADNTDPCDDGDSCTNNDVCAAGLCSGVVFAVCGPCLTCDVDGSCIVPSSAACEPALPGKSRLAIKDSATDTKDTLTWAWAGGSGMPKAAFGTPTATSDLTLCLYDQSGGATTLLLSANAPAAGDCDGKPCWKETSTGFKYADKALTPDGLLRMQLRGGGSGAAKITLRGKGANLGPPALALVPPVTVRLERGDGSTCWASTYTAPSKNEPGLFRAKSQ